MLFFDLVIVLATKKEFSVFNNYTNSKRFFGFGKESKNIHIVKKLSQNFILRHHGKKQFKTNIGIPTKLCTPNNKLFFYQVFCVFNFFFTKVTYL